jgi:hypothetical protein
MLADLLHIADGGWFTPLRFADVPWRKPRAGEDEFDVPKRPMRFQDEKFLPCPVERLRSLTSTIVGFGVRGFPTQPFV